MEAVITNVKKAWHVSEESVNAPKVMTLVVPPVPICSPIPKTAVVVVKPAKVAGSVQAVAVCKIVHKKRIHRQLVSVAVWIPKTM